MRAVNVNICVQDDLGDDVLGFLSIRLSQASGFRASQVPLETAEIAVVVSYRVLPENLAHLSRPGKQPQTTSAISVAAGTAKQAAKSAMSAMSKLATARPASATTVKRPPGSHATQRRPAQSARRSRERDEVVDLGDAATSTIFHRLSEQANQRIHRDDKLRSV